MTEFEREDSDENSSEDEVSNAFSGDGSEGFRMKKLEIDMYRHSIFDIHSNNKVKCIVMNTIRGFMYSIGMDRKLYVTCMIGDNKDQVHIKCSNMSPKTMVLHEEYDRLFVSMK